jgi:SAM-dependent methyltransferase
LAVHLGTGALAEARLADCAEAVARRYAAEGRLVRGFVAGKLRRDPATRAVLSLAGADGFGHVLDIGCGRGQLALALLLSGHASAVTGIDRNAAHLAQAVRAAQFGAPGLDFRALQLDLSAGAALPVADTVLMIDVLYQLEPSAQDRLLHVAATAARQNLLIRTADPGRGLRSLLTRAYEVTTRRISPHGGDHVAHRPPRAIAGALRRHGFRVRILPCWQGTPFANVLLFASRSRLPHRTARRA